MLGERKDKGLKQQSPSQDLTGRGGQGFRTEALIPAWLMSCLSGQQAFPQPGQDLRHNHKA